MYLPQTNSEYTAIGIMTQYESFDPVYKLIYPSKGFILNSNEERLVYKVKLNDGRKLILKHVKLSLKNEQQLYTKMREYYIGKAFGILSENVVKIFDVQQKIVENNMIVIEMIKEYGGKDISLIKYKLQHKDNIRIMWQLGKTLKKMESLGMAHFDINTRNMIWNKKLRQIGRASCRERVYVLV